MSEKEYRRLTRLRRRSGRFFEGLVSYSSLWLGKDHLLSIDSNRLAEDYKRFYFRDIEAITIVKTRRREIWNLVLLFLLLLSGAFFLNGSTAGGVSALIVGPFLLLNNALGPTCTVYLRTAVQLEQLPSLSRLRRAHKTLAVVRPLIAAAQGQLAPEEASLRIRELFESSGQKRVVTGPMNLSG